MLSGEGLIDVDLHKKSSASNTFRGTREVTLEQQEHRLDANHGGPASATLTNRTFVNDNAQKNNSAAEYDGTKQKKQRGPQKGRSKGKKREDEELWDPETILQSTESPLTLTSLTVRFML